MYNRRILLPNANQDVQSGFSQKDELSSISPAKRLICLTLENDLKKFIIKNKKIPKIIDLRMGRLQFEGSEKIGEFFGSYYNLFNSVIEDYYEELNKNSICDSWFNNRNSILIGTKRLIESLGRIPKQTEYIEFASENKYYQRYNWLFDDYNTVIKYATGKSNTLRTKYREDEVINNIKLLAKHLGKTPSYRDYLEFAKENGLCTNIRYYQPWNYFIMKAGFEEYNKKYTKEEIEELFFRLKNKLGRVPLREEFEQEKGYPSAYLIDKYFGSYNNLLSLFELELNHRDKYEDEELAFYINNYISKYGKNPTKYAFALENGPNPSIYQKRFGSWSNAIKILTGKEHYKLNQMSYAYKSNHGDIRPSYQEGIIDDLIGSIGLKHRHDVYYKELVNTNRNYTMDFLFDNNMIIEVAGLISESEFINDGINLKEEFKKEYLIKLKEKINLIKDTKYRIVVIFKNEKLESIIKKLCKITNQYKTILSKEGRVINKNIRNFTDTK